MGPAPHAAASFSSWDDTIERNKSNPNASYPYRRSEYQRRQIPDNYRDIGELAQQPAKTKGYASERVVLPTVGPGKRSLNTYEMISPELVDRVNRMQNSPKYQESINTREHLRPYQVVQRQADDAKEWFNSHTDFLKLSLIHI